MEDEQTAGCHRKFTDNEVEIEEVEDPDVQFPKLPHPQDVPSRISHPRQQISNGHANKPNPTVAPATDQYAADFESEESSKRVLDEQKPSRGSSNVQQTQSRGTSLPKLEKTNSALRVAIVQSGFGLRRTQGRKTPADHSSVFKSRLGRGNLSYAVLGSDVSLPKLNVTEGHSIVNLVHKKRSITVIKQRPTTKSRTSDALLAKIYDSLQRADQLISQCNRDFRDSASPWRLLECRNLQLDEELRGMSQLLTQFVLRNRREISRGQSKGSGYTQSPWVDPADCLRRKRQFEEEFERTRKRLSQVVDPGYGVGLRERCRELGETIHAISQRKARLELQRKLEAYVMTGARERGRKVQAR